MKKPEECRSLEDVRGAIDQIDREVIASLARRAEYVRVAGSFKKTEHGVRAPARVETMLAQRRTWAEEDGLDPAFVEALYRQVVDYFVRQELATWKRGGQ